jgi:hypothetical protein
MHVYRNGILIGRSTVSTGSKGPRHAGRRLQHSREKAGALLEEIRQRADAEYAAADVDRHRMHSGNLPGYPRATAASGCRLISRSCFSARRRRAARSWSAMARCPVPHLASSPGLMLAPKDFTPEMLRRSRRTTTIGIRSAARAARSRWWSAPADKAIYVYRNGNPIGRASIEIDGRGSLGNHVFSMLEGTSGRLSFLVPGKQARRRMRVTSSGRSVEAEEISVAPAHEPGVRGESL